MSLTTSDLSLNDRLKKELDDSIMRKAIASAQDTLNTKRNAAFAELGNYEEWRDNAAAVRHHVLENLDFYLNQFAENASRQGAHVTFTTTAKEATDAALNILQAKGVKKAVKSKSMVTEEVGLNEALDGAGIEVIETDLGEYILQTDDNDKPSHIVVPALHRDREHIREVFARKKGYTGDSIPENITRFVRGLIRQEFLDADVGITGCNFAVADSGTVTLVTNEGNGRFVTTAPKTQIVFMGMERIVPTFVELDMIFSMLVRSAVGGKLTSYLSFITGPKGTEDRDGPEELHIIIVDNGRSEILGSRFQEVLRCIRCGTCMLECPAYRHISGHGYGTLYPGPLGLALVPLLGGYEEYSDVTKICSLCSACNDVCPVKIPLYEYIYEHRRIIAEDKKLVHAPEPFVMSQYGKVIGSSRLYNFSSNMARFAKFLPEIGPLKEWTRERDLPDITGERFRDWFKKHGKKGGES